MHRLPFFCLPLLVSWLCLFPVTGHTADPVGGETITWRELVFQPPPGWFRTSAEQGRDEAVAVFTTKSDGILAVVTVSVLDTTLPETDGTVALLKKLHTKYTSQTSIKDPHIQEESAVSVMSQKQAPFLTYQSRNKRYFLFFPPGNDEIYNINVVIPAAAEKHKPPDFVNDFLSRVQTSEAWQEAEAEAAEDRLEAMQQVRLRMPPVQTAPFLEIESLSQTQWDGAVASAQQAVGMLYGDLSPEEQKKFNDSWAPMRGFPTQKCVDYLNDLNPLLGEFLALRTAINRTSGQ
ncbi:MAG: hypothetical protein R6Y91_00245, partial [Desulfohalobium sp.]